MSPAPSSEIPSPEPASQIQQPPAEAEAVTDPEEPARHVLRHRTVQRFRSRPDEPQGAIPLAVRHVVGGPMMWSEKPVRANQFTAEQRDLVLRAAREIKELYLAAGGQMKPPMLHDDALGLMPDNAGRFPYQSEEWAAAKAINAGLAFAYSDDLPEPARLQAELAQAYYIVITWIDYVEGGLLDASEIYEEEDEEA